ncbi:MAG: hypothetical protein KGL94_05700 [Acidobacteriota bacterium]|nr:hypothetical protein [Acidobacteriota bacterium]
MRKALVLAVSALTAALLLGAAAQAADNPHDQGYTRPAPGGSYVAVVGCFANGGSTTVPAGTPFTAFAGWGAAHIGQVVAWLNESTNTLSVDGGAPIDMSPYFAGLTSQFIPGNWADIFFYTLPALAPGQSEQLAYSTATSHPTEDGVTGFPGPPQPAGSSTFTCTVTGA